MTLVQVQPHEIEKDRIMSIGDAKITWGEDIERLSTMYGDVTVRYTSSIFTGYFTVYLEGKCH